MTVDICQVPTKATPLLNLTGEGKNPRVSWEKDKERSFNNYHPRQKSIDLGKLV